MAGRGLCRRLDTSNLAFNCDDLLSVQSCSPHSAWNSDDARMILGKLLRLSRVGPNCYRDRCLCRDLLAGEDKDKVVSRLLLAPSPHHPLSRMGLSPITCFQERLLNSAPYKLLAAEGP